MCPPVWSASDVFAAPHVTPGLIVYVSSGAALLDFSSPPTAQRVCLPTSRAAGADPNTKQRAREDGRAEMNPESSAYCRGN